MRRAIALQYTHSPRGGIPGYAHWPGRERGGSPKKGTTDIKLAMTDFQNGQMSIDVRYMWYLFGALGCNMKRGVLCCNVLYCDTTCCACVRTATDVRTGLRAGLKLRYLRGHILAVTSCCISPGCKASWLLHDGTLSSVAAPCSNGGRDGQAYGQSPPAGSLHGPLACDGHRKG